MVAVVSVLELSTSEGEVGTSRSGKDVYYSLTGSSGCITILFLYEYHFSIRGPFVWIVVFC